MDSLVKSITKAAVDKELCRAVGDLYRQVEMEVGQLEVSCRQCGKCCCFGKFGQALLASTAEVGYLLAWLKKQPSKLKEVSAKKIESSHEVCPFLEDEHCGVREGRALGCRVFFCQAEALDKERMENMYEDFHKRIVDLHEQSELSYQYLGWGEAMSAIKSAMEGS